MDYFGIENKDEGWEAGVEVCSGGLGTDVAGFGWVWKSWLGGWGCENRLPRPPETLPLKDKPIP